MSSSWPSGFARIPDQDWIHQKLETLALKYDTVENHGWYSNLDSTVDEVAHTLRPGDTLIDYSGGTGIFVDRLFAAHPHLDIRIIIVDASQKFLRLALDKFHDDERVAFRWIRYIKDKRRLELVDEVIPFPCDALVSTNAVHLYYDLPDTLTSWSRTVKNGAHLFVQSGNIRNPDMAPDHWIIDETVEKIHEAAMAIVRRDDRFDRYREVLNDGQHLQRYNDYRKKIFLPVRPLSYYVECMNAAGLRVHGTRMASIVAKVEEWYLFLSVYHDGVLGWMGGVEKLDGRPPSDADIQCRLVIMKEAMNEVFENRPTFQCAWTYISAQNQPGKAL